jgi:hypothetical protein
MASKLLEIEPRLVEANRAPLDGLGAKITRPVRAGEWFQNGHSGHGRAAGRLLGTARTTCRH